MKKRIAAALLWFYVGWLAWSIVAWFAGLPEIWGPVLGTVLAAVFAGDPLGKIWNSARTPEPAASAAVPAASAPEPA